MVRNFAAAKAYLVKIWRNEGVQQAVEQSLISAAEAVAIRVLVRVGLGAAGATVTALLGALIDAVWHLS